MGSANGHAQVGLLAEDGARPVQLASHVRVVGTLASERGGGVDFLVELVARWISHRACKQPLLALQLLVQTRWGDALSGLLSSMPRLGFEHWEARGLLTHIGKVR